MRETRRWRAVEEGDSQFTAAHKAWRVAITASIAERHGGRLRVCTNRFIRLAKRATRAIYLVRLVRELTMASRHQFMGGAGEHSRYWRADAGEVSPPHHVAATTRMGGGPYLAMSVGATSSLKLVRLLEVVNHQTTAQLNLIIHT